MCSGEQKDEYVCAECQCLEIPTCVSISCGIVCCWIQGWTSASSSLCSWLNQGWRCWSTRSFSLSSVKTSPLSLEERQDRIQSKDEGLHDMREVDDTFIWKLHLTVWHSRIRQWYYTIKSAEVVYKAKVHLCLKRLPSQADNSGLHSDWQQFVKTRFEKNLERQC